MCNIFERIYLKNIQNNEFLKVRNSLLESEKDFMKLEDKELKDIKEKIEKEIEKLVHKPIIVSKDDMKNKK